MHEDRARGEIAIVPTGTSTFPPKRFVRDFTRRFRGNAGGQEQWLLAGKDPRLAGPERDAEGS
jgi:hypothetical protein